MDTFGKVVSEEGPRALWKGLVPGLQHQIAYDGLAVGLYVPIRDIITGPLKPNENPSFLSKLVAGTVTSAFAITVSNPTQVVKIRMQSQGQLNVHYKSTWDCYRTIMKASGLQGLWVGWGANIGRNVMAMASKLASYD